MCDGAKVYSKARTSRKHVLARHWAADLEAKPDQPGGLSSTSKPH